MKPPSQPERDALGAAATAPRVQALQDEARRAVAETVRALLEDAACELASARRVQGVAGDRQYTAPALEWLQGRRAALAAALTAALDSALQPAAAAPRQPAAAPGARLQLTLIDEAQIDEEIETARIVQAVESEADAELRQLRALASGLAGLPGIDPAAAPLSPLACANGLRAGLGAAVADTGTRLFLMRQLGPALGRALKRTYAALAERIDAWGVEPAPFRLKSVPAAAPLTPAAATMAPAPATAAAPAPASAALWRMVERAHAALARTAPEAGFENTVPGDGSLALRLFDEPLPAGGAAPALDAATAVAVMDRLLGQIEAHLGAAPGTQRLLQALQQPARQLAGRDSGLWQRPDHPWWRMLDRLITVGTVHDDDGPVTAAMAQVVEQVRRAPALDADTCTAAADALDRVAARHHATQHSQLGEAAEPMQQAVDREEVELSLRNQVVQQLRSTPVSAALRRFLVGPWTRVLAHAALRHGPQSEVMNERAFVVDDLIRATSRAGRPVSPAQQRVLLRQVADALAQAGWEPARVQAELAELQGVLREPPPLQEESWEEAIDTLPTPAVLDLHAGLPTVPIHMGASDTGADSTLAAERQQDWLDTLAPGAYCRLFLLGHWLTAQLSWVSETRTLFLFSSRHGGRTHSLTRRMLAKLRNAGLATHIEDGFLLAQAMEQLADTDFGAPGPAGA